VATLEEALSLLSGRARHASVTAMAALLRCVERSRSLAQGGEADDRSAGLDAVSADQHA
jgi:hypothetical protein